MLLSEAKPKRQRHERPSEALCDLEAAVMETTENLMVISLTANFKQLGNTLYTAAMTLPHSVMQSNTMLS